MKQSRNPNNTFLVKQGSNAWLYYTVQETEE